MPGAIALISDSLRHNLNINRIRQSNAVIGERAINNDLLLAHVRIANTHGILRQNFCRRKKRSQLSVDFYNQAQKLADVMSFEKWLLVMSQESLDEFSTDCWQ